MNTAIEFAKIIFSLQLPYMNSLKLKTNVDSCKSTKAILNIDKTIIINIFFCNCSNYSSKAHKQRIKKQSYIKK